MAMEDQLCRNSIFLFISTFLLSKCYANDILGCGGFVKSHVPLDFSKIEIGLYTNAGSLKERTECAPTNGYYFLPLYEKGEYVLKVHPPAGWSFEPSQVALLVDGATDACSTNQDINFAFNGFGITGRVITAGQPKGPSGIGVQLINDKGDKRDTVTSAGGDFHFTPVIPGKYTLKASHPRWKLDPAQAVVQVKEGNTALPVGVLAVKGYDVKGSVISFGSPIGGIYVLLYSKEDNPKLRVEGCKTALLQGIPDSPICHAVTNAQGEFSFGLVPAGEYKLVALSQTPGQASVRYNIKPDIVPFTVAHDSLYIKNAFEVSGFTVIGSVVAGAGAGLSGARVLLDGRAVGTSDAAGKFTLPSLQPATYTISFQHEQCEFEDVSLSVAPSGVIAPPAARVARWRVCGAVAPPALRQVAITGEGRQTSVTVRDDGKWCTFLPPGVYTAKVEVSDAEQREGLQFYPLSQKISVQHAPVDGVSFSQLKATVSGAVRCKAACGGLRVTLTPLAPDGGYAGPPVSTDLHNGEYKFVDVLPGSVEVSVPATHLCWVETRHNVAVTSEHAAVPAFQHTGYVIPLQSSHDIEVEYSSKSDKGTAPVPAGSSQLCVNKAERYTLTPRGPHSFQPAQAHATSGGDTLEPVQFAAVAHAAVITVLSPAPVTDLLLNIRSDTLGNKQVGPLPALAQPAGGFAFQHTLYMKPGEVAAVWAESSSLLFVPPAPAQVMGGDAHRADALVLRAVAGLTLAGGTRPPVEGVTVTLASGDLKLTQVTTKDGTYSFGPLDASKHYTVTAEKESYVFGDRDEDGIIVAHKLAEITAELVDDADNTPLQGALVSVSGGSYRRNLASGADGRLRFAALSPAQYYVKPNMKEYRFTPPHHILRVSEGHTHHVTLRGVRVAWSCFGRLVSLGGAGWAGGALLAAPSAGAHCAAEEASTDADGSFRIRGLLPNCVYTLQLKESTSPDLRGLKLAKAPPTIQVLNNKDITDVLLIAVQPSLSTDASVLVRSRSPAHCRSLRLSLAPHPAQPPLFSARLDKHGCTAHNNPGVMFVLPRLPADNKTYILQLESSLSKSTHSFEEEVHYFNSDGKYKVFNLEFSPKVKSSEQELRQTSLLVIPLAALLALAYLQRDTLLQRLAAFTNTAHTPPPRQTRQEVLDKASIHHILATVNAAGKRTATKKNP